MGSYGLRCVSNCTFYIIPFLASHQLLFTPKLCRNSIHCARASRTVVSCVYCVPRRRCSLASSSSAILLQKCFSAFFNHRDHASWRGKSKETYASSLLTRTLPRSEANRTPFSSGIGSSMLNAWRPYTVDRLMGKVQAFLANRQAYIPEYGRLARAL